MLRKVILSFLNKNNLTLELPISITKFILHFFIKLQKHLNRALFKINIFAFAFWYHSSVGRAKD